MRSLVVLASVVLVAASAANCADVPGEANSIGSIAPSALAAPSSTVATLSTTAAGGTKGKPGTVDTIPILKVRMIIDADGNGLPNYGDQISIDVSTDTWDQVAVICSQNGIDVYGSIRTNGVDTAIPMALWSGAWAGGAADCIASLIGGNQKSPIIASLPFTVFE